MRPETREAVEKAKDDVTAAESEYWRCNSILLAVLERALNEERGQQSLVVPS